MRFIVQFNQAGEKGGRRQPGEETVNVPPESIRTWIYATLATVSPAFARKMHDGGTATGTGRFKPLVFSRLYGNSRGYGLKVSSPSQEFVGIFGRALNMGAPPMLTPFGMFEPVDVSVREFADTKKFFTLSPILLKDGLDFTAPDGPGALKAVDSHLKRKFFALYGSRPTGGISAFEFLTPKHVRVSFKGQMFDGVVGEFVMAGDRELMRLAYDAGLGCKNACGFGLIECAGTSR